jgi:hypothetical protein
MIETAWRMTDVIKRILKGLLWLDAQHQDRDIGQRAVERPARYAVDTAAVIAVIATTGRTRTLLTHRR